MKDFANYIILILLNKETKVEGHMYRTYKMVHKTPEEFNNLKTISYNNHKYLIDHEQVFMLHGWVPWLSYNPWNPWRMAYNYIYGWARPTGITIFREPLDPLHGIEIPEPPISLQTMDDKWTPAVVQRVALSPLYKRYNHQLSFSGMKISWQVAVVIGIVFIVVLLIMTGKVNL